MVNMEQTLSKEERILLAAEQVFSRKGYTLATLDEIIKIADTGKGTVYKYYKNKENLFYTLVQKKNEPFLEKLKVIEDSEQSFSGKLRDYIIEMLKFTSDNLVILQVLFFDFSGANRGWQILTDKDGNFKVISRWGNKPTAEEEEILRKYFEILHSHIIVLRYILEEGVSRGELKAHEQMNMWAGHLYGGLEMLVFHDMDEGMDFGHVADVVVDRFMNGHKASL